ncbi:MAG: signal recognition particle-docking protein FtsY [Candidatus Bilamarchaeaceae archaeon]
MFDLLKKKIGGFIDGLVKKEEAKPHPVEGEPSSIMDVHSAEAECTVMNVRSSQQPSPLIEKEQAPLIKSKPAEPEPQEQRPEPKPISIPKPKPEQRPVKISAPKPEPKKEQKHIQKPEPKKEVVTKPALAPEPGPKKENANPATQPKPVPEERKEEKKEDIKEAKIGAPKKEEKTPLVKLGLPAQLLGLVTGEVTIAEPEIRDMLDEFELELLESDVDMQVAEDIKGTLKAKLVGAKVKKSSLNRFMQESLADTLKSIILDSDFDLVEYVRKAPKPVKVMLLGTNGAGKTTTIAKLTHLLKKNGFKVALCAADTFRAAAIEQLGVHADRLGVRVIKRDYGSDPTAVAFDGVSYAKAHNLDVVLIDTAGRQETNYNLVNELKKMNRVIQPELKIYIGESIAGNSIIEQVSAFNKEIGVNGVILTKIDCDAKGGTVISISKATGVPIYYLGTGQGYDDLEPFDKGKLVERIVG